MRRISFVAVAVATALLLFGGSTYKSKTYKSGFGSYPSSRQARGGFDLLVSLPIDGRPAVVTAEGSFDQQTKIAVWAYQDGKIGEDDHDWEYVAEDTSDAAAWEHSLSASPSFNTWSGDSVKVVVNVYDSEDSLLETRAYAFAADSGYNLQRLVALAHPTAWNEDADTLGWLAAKADSATVYDVCVRDDSVASAAAGVSREFAAMRMYNNAAANDVVLDCRTVCSNAFAYSPATANSRGVFFWYSALDSIPDDATIESAYLIASPDDASYVEPPAGAFHFAAVCVFAEDAAWVDAGAGGYGVYSRNVTLLEVNNTTNTVWSPTIAQRTDNMDAFNGHQFFGIVGSTSTDTLCGPGANAGQGVGVGGKAVRYDITRGVQWYVDFRDLDSVANAGIYVGGGGSAVTAMSFAGVDHASDWDDAPMLVVNYSERPRTVPWGGVPVPVAISTDDQVLDYNLALIDSVEAYGGVMSLCVRGDVLVSNSATRMRAHHLETARSNGHEIVHHSLSSISPSLHSIGLMTWGAADSMFAQITRTTWIADSLTCADTTCAVDAFAYPSGDISMYAVKKLSEFGFEWSRATAAIGGLANLWCTPSYTDPHPGARTFWNWYEPTNMYAINVVSSSQLVGGDADDYSQGTVNLNIRKETARVINEFAPFIVFAHEPKDSTTYSSSNIDYDEWGWILSYISSSDLYGFTTYSGLYDDYQPTHPYVAPIDYDRTNGFAHSAYDSLWQTDGDSTMLVIWRALAGDSRFTTQFAQSASSGPRDKIQLEQQ